MKLSVGDKLYGFTVNRVRFSDELGGTLNELTHDKTGAQVCWIDNGDTNKLFDITFKTLPEDSTGVFHILEHSVLCGSKKYPVREPFVELLKSSMNTFLNAMTGSDFTTYPVSSRNEQDYLNLASVYMDAVFAPRILEDANIFYQEGHHIEQNEGELTYKGVVFNEMKGAMGDEDRAGEQKLMSMIFRDNSYGFNSGGDPEVIPTLTYEQFIASYKRHYHPSNARVYLDGDVPFDKTLALLESYFSTYEREENLPEVVMQKAVGGEETMEYEVSESDEIKDKEHLQLGKIICSWQDRVKIMATMVLCDVLAGSNEAPLKRAILSNDLAQNFTMYGDESIAQPVLTMTVKGIRDGKVQEVRNTLRATAEELYTNGLSRAALEASINRLEFRMREPKEPAGLIRGLTAMSTWLHGGDPMANLVYDEIFASVRALLDNRGFEALLKELLLDEEGLNVLHMLPSRTLGEEKRARENAKLKAIAESWTDEEWAANKALNENLAKWQKTEDTPEQLATLPVLSLDQVSEEVDFMPTEESTVSGVKILYHPAKCSGIVHVNLYFNLSDCTLEELTRLQMLKTVLGKLPTRQHDALTLQQILKNDVGRMEFSISTVARRGETDRCTPQLVVSCSVLEEKLPRAEALMLEILTETLFDQKDRIREFVMQAELYTAQMGVGQGHVIGIRSAMSHTSAKAAVDEALSGYTSIQYVHDFAKNFDERIDDAIALYERIAKETVCRARLVASITGAKQLPLDNLLNGLKEGYAVPASASYESKLPMRMGVRIPAQISYAVQGASMKQLGYEKKAAFNVAENIITLNYLWNMVRVQGGAYGTALALGKENDIFTYSYRDPTPARSLDVNAGIADYLTAFCESGEALDKYIISTIAGTEPLVAPRGKGMEADSNWFCGFTREYYENARRDMLHTTREDVLAFCNVARDFAEKGAVCVVGFTDALSACKDLEIFDI